MFPPKILSTLSLLPNCFEKCKSSDINFKIMTLQKSYAKKETRKREAINLQQFDNLHRVHTIHPADRASLSFPGLLLFGQSFSVIVSLV